MTPGCAVHGRGGRQLLPPTPLERKTPYAKFAPAQGALEFRSELRRESSAPRGARAGRTGQATERLQNRPYEDMAERGRQASFSRGGGYSLNHLAFRARAGAVPWRRANGGGLDVVSGHLKKVPTFCLAK